ncbi:MAG: tRNA (adenosine(37)-N6)-dimethylallyltransferase MiaA [Ancrocorticia sp.]|uniref:tRNA (adenosine(37)-N6)-dimethylallyltransferase MiaA n=1 Tax=Ancrocorticia sp. TaxID=2593684 RepID=UPI003F9351AF
MIITIVGPTASGKTALSIEVAEALGGPDAVEIISADAMQRYRGMDIGTAKITATERHGIRHHQLDVLDLSAEASVAAYQRDARQDLESIQSGGKIPMIVGGSGLYVSALLDELEFPGHDAAIRAQLEEEAAAGGFDQLLAELEERDPQSRRTIDPRNQRRIIRALEVIRLTGEPFTPKFPRHTSHYEGLATFAVTREMPLLEESITARTAGMFEQGLIEETRTLLGRGLREAPTASRATGYAEAIAVIDGRMSEDEAADSISFATRRLAKKQGTWFRADPRLTWLDLSGGDINAAAAQIVRSVRS